MPFKLLYEMFLITDALYHEATYTQHPVCFSLCLTARRTTRVRMDVNDWFSSSDPNPADGTTWRRRAVLKCARPKPSGKLEKKLQWYVLGHVKLWHFNISFGQASSRIFCYLMTTIYKYTWRSQTLLCCMVNGFVSSLQLSRLHNRCCCRWYFGVEISLLNLLTHNGCITAGIASECGRFHLRCIPANTLLRVCQFSEILQWTVFLTLRMHYRGFAAGMLRKCSR